MADDTKKLVQTTCPCKLETSSSRKENQWAFSEGEHVKLIASKSDFEKYWRLKIRICCSLDYLNCLKF
jgi:hypothetical protein